MLPAYLDYWGLTEAPFSLAPNPRMFYLSDQHRECLMRLKFAIHSGKGGALLISENAGNGKTTTLNLLMRELSEDEGQYRIAYLDYPTMTPEQMIGEISRQIGVGEVSGDKVTDMNALRDMLRSNHIRGLKNLVIVDEGQMMADRPELLQEFRILLNCCSAGEFLLSFILSGQAPLEPAVRALPEFWQRLPVRFFLKDLHPADTTGMIHHRLRVAGATRPIFTSTATEGVYRHSKGCPRVICAVADLALVVGHSNRSRQVDFAEVSQACSDMEHSGTSYHYFNFLEEEGQGGTVSQPPPPPPPLPTTTPEPRAAPKDFPVEAAPTNGASARDVTPIAAGPAANAAPAPAPAAVDLPALQASKSSWAGGGTAQAMPTPAGPALWTAPSAPVTNKAAPVTETAPVIPEVAAGPARTAVPHVGSFQAGSLQAASPQAVPLQPPPPHAAIAEEAICPACGTHCMVGTDVCPKCAAMLRVSCGKCGAGQDAQSKACGYCGFPLHAWAKEAEREFLAGLKRLNLYKTPEQLEEIKFGQHRTLDGRVLYFAAAAKVMRGGAKVREVKGDGTGRMRGCGVIVGNRRLVLLDGKRTRDIPLGELSHCEPVVVPGKDAGGVVVRYRDRAFELNLPVREGRRAGFYRLLQAYLNRMGKPVAE